ncbi:MAG: GNAT family N-acetyltransferase [Clostridia bacterium]|nr:GNAT family N-acetyltransferase [Clostridia bacterium]
MISPLEYTQETYDVIHRSFYEIANTFNMTPQNCPGNTAFMSYAYFLNQKNKIQLFGIYDKNLVGCIGVEKKSDVRYKIKWLCVLDEYRHQGYGKLLIDFSVQYIKELGGKKVQLGMFYENQVLHHWYLNNGFQVEQIKAYKSNDFKICYMEMLL